MSDSLRPEALMGASGADNSSREQKNLSAAQWDEIGAQSALQRRNRTSGEGEVLTFNTADIYPAPLLQQKESALRHGKGGSEAGTSSDIPVFLKPTYMETTDVSDFFSNKIIDFKPKPLSDGVSSFMAGSGDENPLSTLLQLPNEQIQKLTADELRRALGEKNLGMLNAHFGDGRADVKLTDAQLRNAISSLKGQSHDVVVKAGDSLWKIARDELGSDATNAEILQFVKAVAEMNKLAEPDKVNPGQVVKLPGSDRGGVTIVGPQGELITKWPDGKIKYTDKNGRGFEQTKNPDGTTRIHNFGPRSEDNFDLRVNKDGSAQLLDKTGKASELIKDKDVEAQRKHLIELAEKNIKNPEELARFRADMARLEDRAVKQKMSPNEVAETYKQIGRVLEARGNQPLTSDQRRIVAEQILANAAVPTSTDQGYHNTCNVTTVENKINTNEPSKAAKLVADVALTGEYKASDGTRVKLDQKSLTPDFEAVTHPAKDGKRNFASQLFQVTAVNLELQKKNPHLRYEQRQVPLSDQDWDTGERIVDTSKNPPIEVSAGGGRVVMSPGLDDDQIVDAHNTIVGRNDTDVMIDHESAVCGPGKKVTVIRSEKELNDKLAQLKREGKLPVIIGVDTNVEPFWTDSGRGTAGGSGGPHVVNVTDYIPGPPAKVAIDNQWGSRADHSAVTVSVHDLYQATCDPMVAQQELEKDVKYNRANNQIDTYKELELIRLKHSNGVIDEKQMASEMKTAMDDAKKRWEQQKKNGTFNQSEYDRAQKKYGDMIQTLSPKYQYALLVQAQETGMLKADRFEDAFAWRAAEVLRQKEQEVAEGKFSRAREKEFNEATATMNDALNALRPDQRKRIQDAILKLRGK